MSNAFDEQKLALEKAMGEMKVIRKENESLKQQLQLLEAKFEDVEMKERTNNVIVTGVPPQTNPNTGRIMTKILTKMGLEEHENNILESFRLTKDQQAPILVKLKSAGMKKEIIRKIRQLKGIKVKACGLDGTDGQIYLNEDLPINKRNLFKRVRDFRRENNYKSAFCTNGVIYLKKNDHEPGVRIRSEKDLPR